MDFNTFESDYEIARKIARISPTCMSPIEAIILYRQGSKSLKTGCTRTFPIATSCSCHYQFVVAIVLYSNNGRRRCWVNKKGQDALDVDFTDDLRHGFYLKCGLNQSISIQVPIGKKRFFILRIIGKMVDMM